MARSLGKLLMPFFLLVAIVLIVLMKFGFIFLLLALLPSLVAFYVDHERSKPIFATVFACNLAATLPSITPIIKSGYKLKHYDVSSLMGDPATWLFVYSGAAAGWCLIYLCRFAARFLVTLMYEYNIISLENLQKRLVEEWGQQIKQPPA